MHTWLNMIIHYLYSSLPYFVSISMPLYGVIIDKTGRNLIWLFASIILTMGAHTLLTFTFVNPYIPVVRLFLINAHHIMLFGPMEFPIKFQ